MRRRAIVATVVGLGLLSLNHCERENAQPPESGEQARTNGLTKTEAEQVLVQVGDSTITVGEFAAKLAEQSPYLRSRYNSPERRREFLDNMVRFELLAMEARKRGLDKSPEVERVRKQAMVELMLKERFASKLKTPDVSEEEIKAYYKAHRDEFDKPEQVRASHILVRKRGKARKLLKQLMASPDKGEEFRRMASLYSEDAKTRAHFGDLRFFSRPEQRQKGEPKVVGPVARAAFALKEIGDITPELVRTVRGFHIVRLTARRAAFKRSLDDARRSIQNRVWRVKREAAIEKLVQELRSEAKVEEYWEALDDLRVEIPGDAAVDGSTGREADGGSAGAPKPSPSSSGVSTTRPVPAKAAR